MAISIVGVTLTETSIRIDQMTVLRVEVTGDAPIAVVAYFRETETVVPLRPLSSGVWFRDIWGSTIGQCTSTTIDILATDGVSTTIDSNKSISVVEGEYPDPSMFTKSLIESHWDVNKANGTPCPDIASITDVKRVNRDGDWILILEGERSTEERARGFYQNVTYPVTLEIHGKDRVRVRYVLKEVDRIMETYWNNLGSTYYDYMEFRDKGRDSSMASAKIWKFIYSIALIKVFEPREGVV